MKFESTYKMLKILTKISFEVLTVAVMHIKIFPRLFVTHLLVDEMIMPIRTFNSYACADILKKAVT